MKEYIEREVAKREIVDWATIYQMENHLDREDALTALNNIPAADVVEVRHGRVIVHDGHEDEYYEYCSECETMDIHSGDNYCPNCGAMIDKEDAE